MNLIDMITDKTCYLSDFVRRFDFSSDPTGYEDDEALQEYTFHDYLREAADYNAPDLVFSEDIEAALYIFSDYVDDYEENRLRRATLAMADFLQDLYEEEAHTIAVKIICNILNKLEDEDEAEEPDFEPFIDILTEYESGKLTYAELVTAVKRRREARKTIDEFNELGGYLV